MGSFGLMFLGLMVLSCGRDDQNAQLDLNFIKDFPATIFVSHYGADHVLQTDTLLIQNPEDIRLKFPLKTPKYIYVDVDRERYTFFVEPGQHLQVDRTNGALRFQGGDQRENNFLQREQRSIILDPEASFEFELPFNSFRTHLTALFQAKKQVLDSVFPEQENNFFYRQDQMADRALQNAILLQRIGIEQIPQTEKDSLYDRYLDKGLLDFSKIEPYMDSNFVGSFYRNTAITYFLRKKYGADLNEQIQKQGRELLSMDIVAEQFPQPFKTVFLDQGLSRYPEIYDYTPDSLQLMPPKAFLARYREALPPETYAMLLDRIQLWERQKKATAQGRTVPSFSMETLDHKKMKLQIGNRDRALLIDTWASWCGSCISSFPETQALERDHSDVLAVVSVNLDTNFDLFKKGITRFDVPGNQKLFADGAFRGDFAKYFLIRELPHYILIGKDGRLIDGNISLEEVLPRLASLEAK